MSRTTTNAIYRQMLLCRNIQVAVKLPDLGEGTKEATVKEFFVKVGDEVEEVSHTRPFAISFAIPLILSRADHFCCFYSTKICAKFLQTNSSQRSHQRRQARSLPSTSETMISSQWVMSLCRLKMLKVKRKSMQLNQLHLLRQHSPLLRLTIQCQSPTKSKTRLQQHHQVINKLADPTLKRCLLQLLDTSPKKKASISTKCQAPARAAESPRATYSHSSRVVMAQLNKELPQQKAEVAMGTQDQ